MCFFCIRMQYTNTVMFALPSCLCYRRAHHAAVAKELLPPGDADRAEPLQRYRAPGFSLTKVLPLSGVLCFGAYCNFDTRARVSEV